MIFGILLNFLALPLRVLGVNHPVVMAIAGIVALVALVVSILGILRLGAGFGLHIGLSILLCLLMVIPIANLVALLILSARATARLQAAGYKVGLLGAKKKG